jgi:hypothetical protein
MLFIKQFVNHHFQHVVLVYNNLNIIHNFLCSFLETADNFSYAGEHEHTAGYDATCTAICMTKMMAYIGTKKKFFKFYLFHFSSS